MHVLVLGATGFIGGHVARALAERGYAVRATRRARSVTTALDGVDVAFVPGDLRDRASLVRAMQGVEAVFHVAGYYPAHSLAPRQALRVAVSGMRAVLGAAAEAGVARVVYTSSLSTIGRPPADRLLADERDFYLPGSVADPYFEAKWAMESEAYRAVATGHDVVVLCPTIVFGPGDVKPTSGIALLALARGLLPVYVEGNVNVVDVRDVAQAHVAALERGRRGERYLLGGHNTTVGALMQIGARVTDVAPPRGRVPVRVAQAVSKLAEVSTFALPQRPLLPISEAVEMIRNGQHYDTSKAQQALGLINRPIDETLRDALDWFRQHNYL